MQPSPDQTERTDKMLRSSRRCGCQ